MRMKDGCGRATRFMIGLSMLLTGFGAAAAELHVPGDAATIQIAIEAATTGDVIVVGPGTWTEPLDLRGKEVTLRSKDGPVVTILDGSTHTTSIITATSGETLATRIEGFTFRNGSGTFRAACNLGGYLGGAIFTMDSGLTIVDSVFEGMGSRNEDDEFTITGGAAIYACESDLDVSGTRFEENLAGFGGAIRFAAVDRVARLTNNQFIGNESAHGGAIQFVNEIQAAAVVSHCTFDGNRASHGGGVRAIMRDRSMLAISDSSFTNGAAAFGGGANLTADRRAVVELNRVTFAENEAGFGGGLFTIASGDQPAWPGGQIHVTNSHFLGNVAHPCCDVGLYSDPCFEDGREGSGSFYGGGIDARTIRGGLITLTNSLFARNTGSRAGGAHASSCDGGTIRFVNTTIVDNEESGLHRRLGRNEKLEESVGRIDVANSIIRDNDSESPLPLEILAENLSATITFSNVTGGTSGLGNIDVASAFVDPETCNYRLLPGSPGIDAGDNDAAPANLTEDLGGGERFVDDPDVVDSGSGTKPVIDIGSYERQLEETSSNGRQRTVRQTGVPCPPLWNEREESSADRGRAHEKDTNETD